ncbi:MAG: hypothetical protein Q9220_001710 [cf. Caloplaca sp. 1 TL-2023]
MSSYQETAKYLGEAIPMQTIWTRVAQSRSASKFSACLSPTTVVTRQAITKAPIRRRLGINDVFTAFFSTVVFASAVVDGNKKTARLEEWRSVIREARKDLQAVKVDQQRRISNLAQDNAAGDGVEFDGTDQGIWQETFAWAEGEIHERRVLGFEDWRGIPLSVLRNASADQIQDFRDTRSLYLPRFKGANGPDVWNSVTWAPHVKKIRTLEWSTANLALELLHHALTDGLRSLPADVGEMEDVLSQLSIASTSDLSSILNYTRDQMRTLSSRRENDEYYHRFASPRFPRYRDDHTPDQTDRLNGKLHSLFESCDYKPDKITKLLPTVCLHLLTSGSPPNVHTYNILISEFAAERRDDLIRCVLDSIDSTHIRPNEVTLAEALRHYVRISDARLFDRFVARMDGFGAGMQTAHPGLEFPELLNFQHRVRITKTFYGRPPVAQYYELADTPRSRIEKWARKAKVKVFEKCRRNQEVHQALIQGALFFHGLSRGMKHYCAMSSEGWEPTQETVMSVLEHASIENDWDAGYAALRRLHGFAQPVEERAYVLMLQLGYKCYKYQELQGILQLGISHNVLPRAVLEMDWQMSPPPAAMLREAHVIWGLIQDLEVLLGKAQEGCHKTWDLWQCIDLTSMKIEERISCPSHETVSLLREAHTFLAANANSIPLETSLEYVGRRIVALVCEFETTIFTIRACSLATQLHSTESSIARSILEANAVLSSIQTRRLVIALVTDLQSRMGKLMSSIHDISEQIRQILTTLHGSSIVFKRFGKYKVRWKCHFITDEESLNTSTANPETRERVNNHEELPGKPILLSHESSKVKGEPVVKAKQHPAVGNRASPIWLQALLNSMSARWTPGP